MQWEKLGQLWAPTGDVPWAKTHATLPLVQQIEADRWWVYISTRDGQGKSRIGRLVVDTSGLANGGAARVLELQPEPVLSLGVMGTFDDSGVMPSWLVSVEGALLLYYIGWNVIGTVPYRLSIGLAISEDGGQTFRRWSQGPIIDRSMQEPFFTTAPCVIRENDKWRMYYVSCTGWENILGRWEPEYHVKYAASDDGIHWELLGRSSIEADRGEAIGRPCVFRRADRYAMLYSRRSMDGYRTNRNCSYRLGYAESADGITWSLKESEVGIERSAAGWDAEMMEYCWVQQDSMGTYLLYNGNGFGATGVGLARLIR